MQALNYYHHFEIIIFLMDTNLDYMKSLFQFWLLYQRGFKIQQNKMIEQRQEQEVVDEVVNEVGYLKDKGQQEIMRIFFDDAAPTTVLGLASPGTGKSTTIARLIEHQEMNIEPAKRLNFLVLTFTKRTRRDLINKLKKLKVSPAKRRFLESRVKNFHSLAFSCLLWRRIIESEEHEEIIEEIINRLNLQVEKERKELVKLTNRTLKKMLSQGMDEKQWQDKVDELRNREPRNLAAVIEEYRQILETKFTTMKETTYDYAILKTVDALNNNQACRGIKLETIDLLIIDEFQDSNSAQLKIIEALLKRSERPIKLLMLGDFDQNIYTWRGASCNEIDTFLQGRPHVVKFLENSYRMSNPVKHISQLLIKSQPSYQQLRDKYYKQYEVNALNKREHEPHVIEFQSEVTEVCFVIDKIYEHIANGVPYGEISILVRGFKNSSFLKRLRIQMERRVTQQQKQPFPFDIQIHTDVLGSVTAKYLLAIFGYILKSKSKKRMEKFMERLFEPLTGIGKADETYKRMKEHQRIGKQYVKYLTMKDNTMKRRETWDAFLTDFAQIEKIVHSGKHKDEQCSFQDVCYQIFKLLQNASWGKLKLKEDKLNEFIELVNELSEDVLLEDRKKQPILSLVRKLLRQDYSNEDQQVLVEKEKRREDLRSQKKPNKVQIQTIHNAKGLEYQIVFLCSLNFHYDPEEDLDTYYKPLSDNDRNRQINQDRLRKIERNNEELRLVYTAITRTSQNAYISSSKWDIFKPYGSNFFSPIPPHPQFVFLKKNSPNAERIQMDRYDEENRARQHYKTKLQEEKVAKEKKERRKQEKNKWW